LWKLFPGIPARLTASLTANVLLAQESYLWNNDFFEASRDRLAKACALATGRVRVQRSLVDRDGKTQRCGKKP
jgi:hypothetical protein